MPTRLRTTTVVTLVTLSTNRFSTASLFLLYSSLRIAREGGKRGANQAKQTTCTHISNRRDDVLELCELRLRLAVQVGRLGAAVAVFLFMSGINRGGRHRDETHAPSVVVAASAL